MSYISKLLVQLMGTVRLMAMLTLGAVMCVSQVDRGSVSGTVIDPSGKAIPNAFVSATNLDTGLERSTRSNNQGAYSLTALPLGDWSLAFSAPGFRQNVYRSFEENIGEKRILNPVLQLSSSGERLTVADAIAHLDQSMPTLSEAVEQQAIQDLPLNGRNWTSLTALSPGAIDQGGSTQRSIRFTGRGRDEMNVTFDGIDATGIVNQAQKAYVRLAIPVSAIAEFRVDAVLPTSETGDASGAQIIVASAAGSNRFSGSVFEYLRNSDFDARSTFDQTKGPLPFRLNQFGGAFAGPIRKNKSFFFINHEEIRQVQNQTLIGFVPSATVRSLTLSQSSAFTPIISDYPLGNGTTSASGIQQWTGAGRAVQNEYSETIRLDHRFTDATTGYLRFTYDNAATIAPLGSLTDRQLNNAKPLNGVAELMHVFSPTFLNEFKFGTNQMVSHAYNLTPFPYTVNVSGFSALNPGQTTNQDGRTFGWLDNVSLVRGRNAVKFGAEIRRVEINEGNSFTGALTYSSLANFESNHLDSATYTALLPLKRMRKTSYFGYAQDEFKLHPNLTFSFGLRYEFYNDFHEATGRAIPFDFQTCGGFCPANAAFLFPAKDNIDPRAGIAWSPVRFQGRTVFRIGYGIYHEDAQLDDQNFPTANDVPRYSLTRGTQFPNLSYPFDSLLATATGVDSPKDQVRKRKDTYVQQWVASIQQSLPLKFAVTLSAIGNKGTDIMNRAYTNLINPASGLRPYPQFGQIELRAKDSNSSFTGAQMQAHRYFSHGWLMTASYMWSHAINDGSLGSGVEDVFPENVSCRRCDRSSSDQDARQSFSVSSVYQLPLGRGKVLLHDPGLLAELFGGWELTGVAGGRTGLPVNITVDRSAAVMPDGNSANQRPNLVSGVPLTPLMGSTPQNWISLAAFAVPAAGTWGNLGRNAFRGPGLWQIDTALQRRITVSEKLAIELRGECFNLLNRAQYGNPLADISAPSTFGRITSLVNSGPTGSGTPRQIEVAVRLVFLGSPSRLPYFHDAVSGDVDQFLRDSTGPSDDYLPCHPRIAQPESNPTLAGGGVSYRCSRVVVQHSVIGRFYFDHRANAVTIASGSTELKSQPMTGMSGYILEKKSFRSDCRYYRVHSAVVVEIGEGRSTKKRGALKVGAGGRRNICESFAGVPENSIGETRRRTQIAVQFREMGVGEKQVLPTIVVEVLERGAPTRKSACRACNAGLGCVVVETREPAEVPKKRKCIVDHACNNQVRVAIVIIIAEISSHPGDRPPGFR